MVTGDDLLTLAEAAALSGLGAATLRGYINDGRLPAVKRGRDWMVSRADLAAYMAGRTARPDRAKPLPPEVEGSPAYRLGCLLALLDREDILPMPVERAYELMLRNPAGTLMPALTRLARNGREDLVADLVATLDEIPSAPLPVDAESDFALGYYHQRAMRKR